MLHCVTFINKNNSQNGGFEFPSKIYFSVVSWHLGACALLGRSPFVLNFGAEIKFCWLCPLRI